MSHVAKWEASTPGMPAADKLLLQSTLNFETNDILDAVGEAEWHCNGSQSKVHVIKLIFIIVAVNRSIPVKL